MARRNRRSPRRKTRSRRNGRPPARATRRRSPLYPIRHQTIRAPLTRVILLEGLHLLRVLTLLLLLLRKVLTLNLLLIGCLFARECLRFILMPAHQIGCLLSVSVLDLPPLRAGTLRRGALPLFFLQMLT